MQCTDPDLFRKQTDLLHNSYVEQLNKTMKEYPSFQIEKESTYPEELSKLNGITKELYDLKKTVRDKTTAVNREIQHADVEIRKLKTIERNLSNYTSYEELDITSKQLLADAMKEYRQEKIGFFIKLFVIFYVFYLLYKRIRVGSWIEIKLVIGLSILMFLGVWLYYYFTSKG
jgi:predicted RND superfamily exporter protein